MTKSTMKKVPNLGRGRKLMLSGGISRRGHLFGYAGLKSKSGVYGGASIGSKGVQGYGGYSKRGRSARLVKNFTTGQIKPRLRLR